MAETKGRAPDAKEGNIALWIEQTRSGKDVYKLVTETGPKDKRTKEYALLYPEINGQKLTPQEAIMIKRGDSVEMQFQGQKGPYTATLALEKIEPRPWRDNPDKVDNVMKVAMVFNLQKKDNGEHYGYEYNNVRFFASAGQKDKEQVKLEARDVVRLGQGESLAKGPYLIRVDSVEKSDFKGKEQSTAKLSVTMLRRENEAETLPDESQLKKARTVKV